MPLESTKLLKRIAPAERISAASDITSHFIECGKQAREWAVGAEVELIGFTRDGLDRINPSQIQSIINGFASQIVSSENEDDYVTEVMLDDAARLTLEPGGQIEYSGAHYASLAKLETALRRYEARLKEIAEANSVTFVAVGFDPVRGIHEQRWIPKQRYEHAPVSRRARPSRLGYDVPHGCDSSQSRLQRPLGPGKEIHPG
jgi:glutamate--cysteine ligase